MKSPVLMFFAFLISVKAHRIDGLRDVWTSFYPHIGLFYRNVVNLPSSPKRFARADSLNAEKSWFNDIVNFAMGKSFK